MAKPLVQTLPANEKVNNTFFINENYKSFAFEITRLKLFRESCNFYSFIMPMYLIFSALKLLKIFFLLLKKGWFYIPDWKWEKTKIWKGILLIPRPPSVFDVGVRNRYHCIQNIFENACLITENSESRIIK